MYEELSRLLAGDLDAPSEAALRARIAADPALSRAWARMSALPAQLAGLSLDAPPAALGERLSRLTDASPDLDAAFDAAFSAGFSELGGAHPTPAALSAAFDRAFPPELGDPADDTLDPDADLLRPSHPVRSRALARAPSSSHGRAAFLDRLLTEARPAAPARSVATQSRTAPVARRAGVLAVVAACALAAGVLLGRQAPGAPKPERAAVALSEGSTTIDGAADVHAGDIHVRVDGRARVTVHDTDPAAPIAPAVVVIATRSDAPASSVAPLAAAPGAARVAAPVLAPDAVAARTSAARGTPARTVTIAVERGAAVVTAVGGPVTVAAGEARRFDTGGAEVSTPRAVATSPTAPSLDVAPSTPESVAPGGRRIVTLDGGEQLRSLTRAPFETEDGTADAEPGAGRADEYGTLSDEDALDAALDSVPGADLFDIDCVGGPCVALFDYDGTDAAWRDQLGAALAEALDAEVTLTSGDAAGLGLVAVTVDTKRDRRVRTDENAARAGQALDKLERELTE